MSARILSSLLMFIKVINSQPAGTCDYFMDKPYIIAEDGVDYEFTGGDNVDGDIVVCGSMIESGIQKPLMHYRNELNT